MRRTVMLVSVMGLLLAACGSSSGKQAVQSTPTTVVAPDTSTSTLPFTTTSLPCQPVPMPNTPVSNPAPSKAVLLTAVRESSDGCVDHIVFDFKGKYPDAPGYSLTYGTPPFVQDGSGAPVPVAGTAFIVVRLSPAYGYDFETGVQTYNGARSDRGDRRESCDRGRRDGRLRGGRDVGHRPRHQAAVYRRGDRRARTSTGRDGFLVGGKRTGGRLPQATLRRERAGS